MKKLLFAQREYLSLLQKHREVIFKDYLPRKMSHSKWGDGFPDGWFFPQMPLLITKTQRYRLESELHFLLKLIREIPKRIFKNDLQKVGEILGIPQLTLEVLASFFPRGKGPYIARPDSVWSPSSWQLLETNIECAVGGAISIEFYLDYFSHLPFWKEWSKRFSVSFSDPWKNFCRTLKDWVKRVYPHQKNPTIAYIAPHSSKDSEMPLVPILLKEGGITVIRCQPEELILKGDSLFLGTLKIDIVFPHITSLELFHEFYRYEHILHSAESGEVILVKELADMLLENKGVLVLLSEERFQHFFTLEEQKKLKKMIPWTRWITEGKTTKENKKIDLIPFIQDHKSGLVIKAANGVHGMFTWIGNETDEETWNKVIRDALEEGEWIVQERVDLPSYNFLYFIEGELKQHLVKYMLLPFCYENQLGGFAVRTSIPEKSLKLTFPEHGNTGVTVLIEIP